MATDSISLQPRGQDDVKIQILPCQPKTLTHLPQRPKVNLGFDDLKYTVQQQKTIEIENPPWLCNKQDICDNSDAIQVNSQQQEWHESLVLEEMNVGNGADIGIIGSSIVVTPMEGSYLVSSEISTPVTPSPVLKNSDNNVSESTTSNADWTDYTPAMLKKPPSRLLQVNKKASKVILKCVSGLLRSGELTAIMGPSGAGKSTLLNILTGYKSRGLAGKIYMNDEERNLSHFRKLSAYIMQDNQLHANLTVDEAMTVAAKLKIGEKTSKQREEIINEILDTLGLLDHRATMTSGLSGGQKKRLSIALELVNNPPVMFFDEPTSGLDSSSCFQCISLLKTLASGGRTIICTIHQPSARLFEMFDQLYTLADGQCVYQGSTKQLVPFLATLGLQCPSYHNPASFIIEVACGEYGDNIKKLVEAIGNGKEDIKLGQPFPERPKEILNNDAEKFPETTKNLNENDAAVVKFADSSKNVYLGFEGVVSEISKNVGNGSTLANEKTENVDSTLLETALPILQPRYGTSQINQFFIILKRALLFSRRDWTLMYLRLFAHILVGLLIGALYYDIGNDGNKVLSNLGFLFFNMLFLMYTSMTITILSFPLEMPVLLKENFNRWYSLRSYYFAITLSDIPFQTVFCVVYVIIVYFMTSQPPEMSRFGMFLAACLLVSFVAQSVGLVVGAAMNVQNGVFLAPVMSVPFLLFSGFFVSFEAIPIYLRWITYLSYIRYGFEGTALATYGFNRTKLTCSVQYCHFKDPMTTLEELDMQHSKYNVDIFALIAIFMVLRIAAYFFLRWKLKSNRA